MSGVGECGHDWTDCPEHGGGYDCTPFCTTCEGNQGYCVTCEYINEHDDMAHNYINWYAEENGDVTTRGYDICIECDCVRHHTKEQWEVMSVENGWLAKRESVILS